MPGRWCESVSETQPCSTRYRRGAVVFALGVGLPLGSLGRAKGAEPGLVNDRDAAAWHPVRVHYRVDPASKWEPCLSHARVQRAVSGALRREVFASDGASDVAVVLRALPDWGVDVGLFDPAGRSLGRRRLRATTCAELTELVVFTLTVMVDFRSDEVAQKRDAALAEPSVNDNVASTDDHQRQVAEPSSDGQTDPAAPDRQPADGAAAGRPPDPAETRRAPSLAPDQTPQADSGSEVTPSGSGQPTGTLRPRFGAAVDTGATPAPLWGAYAELELGSSGPMVLAVRARGQYMPDVVRAGGRLAAWRGAFTVNGCWRSTEAALWDHRLCFGVTPDVMWVSPDGFEASGATWFTGAGLETTFATSWPLGRDVAVHFGVGLGVPLLRNDWHASTGGGGELTLFRAASLRTTSFVGVSFGR